MPDSAAARRHATTVLAAVLAALIALPAIAASTLAATASYTANCSVNLRSTTSTSATVVNVIPSGTVVTASGSVSGGSWSAGGCAGSNATGSSWYAITAVNGQSTSSLYGKSTVYAATGLFSAVAPPPPSSYLLGVDVSSWQGSPNYVQVYGAGYRFVIAKATEGIGFTDGKWTYNRTAVPAAGLRLGGYHYARPDLNGTTAGAVAEADWFASQLQLAPGMLPPALDLEVAGSLTSSQLVAWVKSWLGEVYAKTGARPMIYVSPGFWTGKMANTPWFAQNGYSVLWVAHWTTASQPSVPASNWGGHGWTFWQYADNGTVPGIAGGVDMDRYNGLDLTPVTWGANFALTLPPTAGTLATTNTSTSTPTATVSVKQGAKASLTVGINRTWFTMPVSVTVSGLPASITASVNPGSTSSTTTGLTVSTTLATPVGTYPFTVTGTANGLTRSVQGSVVVTDGVPPTAQAPVSVLVGGTIGSTVPVRTSWAASDPSGIRAFTLDRQSTGVSWGPVALPSLTSTSISQGLAPGPMYEYTVRATDGAGNTSAWAFAPAFNVAITQQSSSAIAYSSGWTNVSTSVASGGSLRYATAAGAWASYTFAGRAIGWVGYRGPNRGQAAVYVDGVYRTTVNLYSPVDQARPVLFVMNWGASGTHTIRIVVTGTAGHPRVDLDAFVRLLPG